jgi:hypothetical protein
MLSFLKVVNLQENLVDYFFGIQPKRSDYSFKEIKISLTESLNI